MTALHVDVLGQGEPILLVHGSLTSIPREDDWKKTVELADHFQLLMPARRGYYLSPDRPPGYGFEQESAEVAEMLGTGAHLVGVSYGGVLSLLAAERRPEAVRSLTVIEPAAYHLAKGNAFADAIISRQAPVYASAAHSSPEDFVLGFIRALRGATPEELPELSAEWKTEFAKPMVRRGVEATMREQPPWEAAISLDRLANTSFPKMVVSGGWSPAFDAVCDEVEKRLSARRAVFTGGGHDTQFIGKPFNDELAEFVEKASAAR